MLPAPIPPPKELVSRFRRNLDRMPPAAGREEAVSQARALFVETFGSEPQIATGTALHIPLQAEHTDYFPGFGLLLALPWAVGICTSESDQEGGITVTGGDADGFTKAVRILATRLGIEDWISKRQIAITSTNPHEPRESFLITALTALGRELGLLDDSGRLPTIADAVSEVIGRPVGVAHALASADAGPISLVDAATKEHLNLQSPEGTGFALVELEAGQAPDPTEAWATAAIIEESIQRLRTTEGFSDLSSLRAIEHRELPDALSALEASARDLIQQLVMEDRRVPRMVAALKRGDTQIFGALMMMSHSARTAYFQNSRVGVSNVIESVEKTEGIYGARLSGEEHRNQVLVFGRSFLLPDFLDAVVQQITAEHDVTPRATLL